MSHDGQDEFGDADKVETDGASDVGVSCDQGSDNQKPTMSTRIPKTPLSRLRSPYSSKPTTPYTSTPGTPHVSRPSTPPISKPETPGHLPNKPPVSRSKTQHLASTPPIAKTTRHPVPVPVAAKLKTLASHAFATRPNRPDALAAPLRSKPLRHFKSTPHLTQAKKPHNLLQPATWPPTRSHASSIGKAYTWPRRGNKDKEKSYNPAKRTPSTTTLAPKHPSTPPSICVHTDLSLH